MAERREAGDQGAALLALYDVALPEVYGYLLRRCGDPALAEDLTSETFMAAVSAVRRGTVDDLTTAWLVTVARRRLVDHWRRHAREERSLALAPLPGEAEEPDWPGGAGGDLDEGRALETLARLGPHHRTAITLRHLDGLSVPEVAEHLGRTVHATEALLSRARAAFRRAYGERSHDAP